MEYKGFKITKEGKGHFIENDKECRWVIGSIANAKKDIDKNEKN